MLLEKIQLEKEENVVKVVRKHWFIIFIELFFIVTSIIIPFIFLLAILLSASDSVLLGFDLKKHIFILVYGSLIWTLINIMVAFSIWTNFFLDLWIITDRRVIVVEQLRFFSRNVSSFRLERLQDIEFNISGIIPTLMDFGTVKIQTASAFEDNFITKGLPNPRELQSLIQRLADKRLNLLSKTRSDVA